MAPFRILAALAAGTALVTLSAAAETIPKPDIEFRLVVEPASPATMPAPAATPTYRLAKSAVLTADDILTATGTAEDAGTKSVLQLTFTHAGTKHFADVTAQNIGKRLAIIINGKIQSAPVIQARIASGHAQLSTDLDATQVKRLADQINAYAAVTHSPK